MQVNVPREYLGTSANCAKRKEVFRFRGITLLETTSERAQTALRAALHRKKCVEASLLFSEQCKVNKKSRQNMTTFFY